MDENWKADPTRVIGQEKRGEKRRIDRDRHDEGGGKQGQGEQKKRGKTEGKGNEGRD